MSHRPEEQLARKRMQARNRRFNKPLSPAEAAILTILPKEGEGITTFKPTAWPVSLIVKKLADQGADHDGVTGRIRSMLYRQLVVAVELVPASDGPGYQITKRGRELLNGYENESSQGERQG